MNLAEKKEFHRWQPAACLRVTGTDAGTFLQGQFTNDLQEAGRVGPVYGLWLNQKGKVLADAFVHRLSDQEHWIVSYFSPVSVIRERLEAYIIADDVVVEDHTPGTSAVTLLGTWPAVLPVGGWKFPGRRVRAPHAELIFSTAEAVDALLAGAVPLTAAEMERRRILAGIPAVPADIGPGDLPNEGGLETEAISYTKGCYLGQEVMARLKSMGQVRRRLVRVRGAGAPPARLAPVFQGGRQVGEVRSMAPVESGWVGWAMIALLSVKAGEPLALTADGPAHLDWEQGS